MDDKDWAQLREIITDAVQAAFEAELDKPLGPWTPVLEQSEWTPKPDVTDAAKTAKWPYSLT